MKKSIYYCGMILLLLVLSACGGLLTHEQPAKQYYTLMPLSQPVGTAGIDIRPRLAIAMSAVPGLDTDRIQVLTGDSQLKPLNNARWPDHLPEVLASVMKRSLAASGLFSEVVISDRAIDSGWSVKLEIQQFYGIQREPGATDYVAVEMAGLLKCNDRKQQLSLTDSSRVRDQSVSAVVSSHQAGLDQVSRQLLDTIDAECN